MERAGHVRKKKAGSEKAHPLVYALRSRARRAPAAWAPGSRAQSGANGAAALASCADLASRDRARAHSHRSGVLCMRAAGQWAGLGLTACTFRTLANEKALHEGTLRTPSLVPNELVVACRAGASIDPDLARRAGATARPRRPLHRPRASSSILEAASARGSGSSRDALRTSPHVFLVARHGHQRPADLPGRLTRPSLL